MSKMSLASIATHYTTEPPRVVIYGPHGIGKTTFGAAAPSPIVLPIEKGLAGIRGVKAFPLATSFADVISAITTLLTNEHDFGTLVVDSLDWLEPLVWEYTALMGGQQDIESFGYGKGYKKADEYWRQVLDGFTALQERKGMVIICTAHAIIKKFDAPDTDAYDRYQIKLHERASGLVAEWADVIGFAHLETVTVTKGKGHDVSTKGQTSGNRVLSVEERPAYQAKNRYGMPPEIPFPKVGAWGLFASAVSGAYEVPPAPEPEPEPIAEAPQLLPDEQQLALENAEASAEEVTGGEGMGDHYASDDLESVGAGIVNDRGGEPYSVGAALPGQD